MCPFVDREERVGTPSASKVAVFNLGKTETGGVCGESYASLRECQSICRRPNSQLVGASQPMSLPCCERAKPECLEQASGTALEAPTAM